MSLHVRHVVHQNSPRIQIRFVRTDLLYKTDETLTSPNGKLTIHGLPIALRDNRAAGPTLADMMLRDLVEVKADEATIIEVVWKLRPLHTLWPDRRAKKKPVIKDKPEKEVDHPFQRALASGGKVKGEDALFVTVEKFTTITIADHAFQLAVGMAGDVDTAHRHISDLAAQAWERDLARARTIFDLLLEANGALIEDSQVAALRPDSSVSQEVEAAIMRECCAWLGVKPDSTMRRKRGRPSTAPGTEGDVIRVTVDVSERVSAHMKRAYHGIAAGIDLADLDILTVIELLGRLRTDKLDIDANLLEAFMDAAAPDWRDRVADQEAQEGVQRADPYEVLGVERGASMDEVRKAYKRAMQRVHPDTSGLARIFSQMVADAYRAIRKERGEE